MPFIQVPSDVTGAHETVKGSDGRMNTSARTDGRAYYHARDHGNTYNIPFSDLDAAVGDTSFYFKNTSTDKDFVITHVGLNSTLTGSFIMQFVTGTASGGTAIVPTNTNYTSSNEAVATCVGGSAVTGLTTAGILDRVIIGATGHEEFRLADTVRLGQNDAVALVYERGAGNTIFEGVLFGYYE